jgi:1-acyl-sn-glycerol-3-phosphate acyltransferase
MVKPMNQPKPFVIGILLAITAFGFWMTLLVAAAGYRFQDELHSRERDLASFLIAFPIGAIATWLYWHPYRLAGFVPIFSTVWCAALLVTAIFEWRVCWLLGLACIVPAIALLQYASHFKVPWYRLAGIAGLFLGMVAFNWFRNSPRSQVEIRIEDILYAMSALTACLALLAWLNLFRPLFELFIEVPLWISFRIRGAGPGFQDVPLHGPCIVIANHACWFDPIFLAKLLPRVLTPMMTGRFYDLPVISFLMRRFGIIKVRETPMKRELPEVQEAIAALDRGECVVVFPEGYLRRSEDRPLKRFGQGIWQILKARPTTPVFACWIDGNWGSYTSYFNGKPTQNKKPDFRRPITLGLSKGIVLDAAVLEHHLATRIFLMNRVIEARSHLGLPELPAFELPQRDDEES